MTTVCEVEIDEAIAVENPSTASLSFFVFFVSSSLTASCASLLRHHVCVCVCPLLHQSSLLLLLFAELDEVINPENSNGSLRRE